MQLFVNFRQWKVLEVFLLSVRTKTGTLTQNKMTVEDYYIDGKRISASKIDITDLAQRRLLDDSILCNDSTNENGVEIGDPTETALINLGSRYGVEAASVRTLYPRKGELPFDSERKMMSTLHQIDGENRMIVKGAVDRLLERTERIWTKAGVRELTEEEKEKIRQQTRSFRWKDYECWHLPIVKFLTSIN